MNITGMKALYYRGLSTMVIVALFSTVLFYSAFAEGVIDSEATSTVNTSVLETFTSSSTPSVASTTEETQLTLMVEASPMSILSTSTREYKQGFSTLMTGTQEVPPNMSGALGAAIFNVTMDEREIDFGVRVENSASITDVVLGCAPVGQNGITVVSLFSTAQSTVSIAGATVTGTITENDIKSAAVACQPNIHTTPHLVQAMREGQIYVNVLTSTYPNGEIRGQLGNSLTNYLPTIPNTGNGGNGTSTGTTTPGNGGGTGTTTPGDTGTTTPGNGGNTGTTTDNGTGTSTDPVNDNGGNGGGGGSHSGSHRSSSESRSNSNDGEVLGASTGPICAQSEFLTGYIKAGQTNDTMNVTMLQVFLNVFTDADLAINGVYDTATIGAVNAFQIAEYEDVLRPWVAYGLPTEKTSTGYVYKTTKWKINSMVCGTTTPRPELP